MSAGLVYPHSFLDSLEPLSKRPADFPPIRAIDAPTFAQLHTKHLLQIGADGLEDIVFPYLHGVEHGGSNLREYFGAAGKNGQKSVADPSNAGEGGGTMDGRPGNSPDASNSDAMDEDHPLQAPDYRGLIWVACNDDDGDGASYADDGLDDEMLVDDDELNVRRPSDASSSVSFDSRFSLLRTSEDPSNDNTSSSSSSILQNVDSMDDITLRDQVELLPTLEPAFIPGSFKPHEIISSSVDELLAPKVPEVVSLRNFGIQVAAYARISDIVVYSPTARFYTQAMSNLANRLAAAHESLHKQRCANSVSTVAPLRYNVFVLVSHPTQLPPRILRPVPSFSQRERSEMQDLTRSSEILPGIFLGNSADVPVWSSSEASSQVFDASNNPDGYDLVIECQDGNSVQIPSSSHLKRAEDHLHTLQSLWATGFMLGSPPPRPAPNAHSILHLPFPCSPPSNTPLQSIAGFISFVQTLLHPSHASRRPKALIYSHDGYTETSVLALTLIMAEKKCSLPDAYLELQVKRGRSFFVHKADLELLKRLESKYCSSSTFAGLGRSPLGRSKDRQEKDRDRWLWSGFGKNNRSSSPDGSHGSSLGLKFGRRSNHPPNGPSTPNTPLPSHDNATWFNHPKFDGSFPSRVLSFLYLGNLNHATNGHMLHALGITHVVSVGERAINPPEEETAFPGKPYGHGSLWLEEREGRIKVLDIPNLSDDGMDSLLPQLGPACQWIEEARCHGGKILVHCRVGVSRSATVTIAYLMKYLRMPLVDAYLAVRSRRLSVLIQPNLRLLFNLLGWEVRLARERSAAKALQQYRMLETNSPALLSREDELAAQSLEQALSWPFLAREVHRLNAKYIR